MSRSGDDQLLFTAAKKNKYYYHDSGWPLLLLLLLAATPSTAATGTPHHQEAAGGGAGCSNPTTGGGGDGVSSCAAAADEGGVSLLAIRSRLAKTNSSRNGGGDDRYWITQSCPTSGTPVQLSPVAEHSKKPIRPNGTPRTYDFRCCSSDRYDLRTCNFGSSRTTGADGCPEEKTFEEAQAICASTNDANGHPMRLCGLDDFITQIRLAAEGTPSVCCSATCGTPKQVWTSTKVAKIGDEGTETSVDDLTVGRQVTMGQVTGAGYVTVDGCPTDPVTSPGPPQFDPEDSAVFDADGVAIKRKFRCCAEEGLLVDPEHPEHPLYGPLCKSGVDGLSCWAGGGREETFKAAVAFCALTLDGYPQGSSDPADLGSWTHADGNSHKLGRPMRVCSKEELDTGICCDAGCNKVLNNARLWTRSTWAITTPHPEQVM